MLTPDVLKFLSGILLSIPLSFILRYIPHYQIRKYYSLILGVLLEYYVYDYALMLSIALHVVMYFLIKHVDRKHCGLFALLTSMILVSGFHVYVMIVDYGRWEIDVSTILMMSICKYSLFAFSYQDGQEESK
jgi:lysophospholipid acyltransferase